MNAFLGETPNPNLTRKQFDDNHDTGIDGAQYQINMFLDTPSDMLDDMLFVGSTLDPEWSYLLEYEEPRGPSCMFPLADVEKLAEYFDRKPEKYDAFMNLLKFGKFPDGGWDTPREGIVCFIG